MAWANFVEAEMKKMAKIFEKLDHPMAEELVPRLGGEFNPSEPIYAGWSRQEMEAERMRKEEVARDEKFFEDHVRLFGEYQREKAEYDAIVRKERQVDEKK